MQRAASKAFSYVKPMWHKTEQLVSPEYHILNIHWLSVYDLTLLEPIMYAQLSHSGEQEALLNWWFWWFSDYFVDSIAVIVNQQQSWQMDENVSEFLMR